MKNISQDVLEKIKDKHIAPKPKWQFTAKNIAMWSAFGVSVAIGSLAFSAVLYRVTAEDWGIYQHLGRGPVPHFFMSLPYIWILAVVACGVLAIYNFKHTKRGYCHKPVLVIVSSIVVALVGGTILFVVGFGDHVDRQLSERKMFLGPKMQMWQQVDKGLLAGEIESLEFFPEKIIIEDFSDKQWEVIYIVNGLPEQELREGMRVKLIGEEVADNKFNAIEIRPWRLNRMVSPRGKFRELEKPEINFAQ